MAFRDTTVQCSPSALVGIEISPFPPSPDFPRVVEEELVKPLPHVTKTFPPFPETPTSRAPSKLEVLSYQIFALSF